MVMERMVTSAAGEVLPALGAGVLAGLAVALPLGAVGVLLLHEGITRGLRSAQLGAAAVAIVDLLYAGAALLAGTAITAALIDRQSQVRLLGAAVLTVLAVGGLGRTWRSRSTSLSPIGTAGSSVTSSPRPGGVFWRFFALTGLNPLTAVYFTVLAASMGERLQEPLPAAAFVLGVFLGSLAWQSVLAVAGAVLGNRLPSRVQVWTSVAGYLIVLVLAVALALSA